jgi:general secretion pathway protein H
MRSMAEGAAEVQAKASDSLAPATALREVPIARGAREDWRGGFTLIEMLAATLIVAMIASLTILSIPGTGRSGLKAVTMEAASLFRRERATALLTRSERRIRLDAGGRRIVGEDGAGVAIPADVTVDILSADNGGGGAGDLVFYPDGESSGGAFRFSREGAEYEVRVNWYTGGVAVASPQS